MLDLRGQKRRRDKEEMLLHLKSFVLEPRFSFGVWYFFPGGNRFHEAYVERGSVQDVLARIKSMYDNKLVDSTLGLEAHYPNEINENLMDDYKTLQNETGIRVISVIPNIFYERAFEFGSLSNNNVEVRKRAIERTKEALELNRELGTEFAIIWPGIDGYENPIGIDFYKMWDDFEKGIAEAMDAVPGVRVAIEPKPYEPRGNNICRNTPNGILMAMKVEALLKTKENKSFLQEGHSLVALNPEVGHVLMGHEELAYALASILREGRLAHTHWNSQPLGNYDQDLNVGVLGVEEALAGLFVLKMYGYKGRFGIDINPERMPAETALTLSMNALKSACVRINGLDFDRMVEAIYSPSDYKGVVEEIVIGSFAPSNFHLGKIN